MSENKKIAVVLFNLGGPDSLQAVKPFLFNLFYDPNIINWPNPFRYLLAKLISNLREKKAQNIYAHMGGKSTILEETQRQKVALEEYLKKDFAEVKVFIAMRHWHPMANETIESLENYEPDQLILLPLYPQFSTTTTKSAIEDFNIHLKRSKLKHVQQKIICCYPDDENFINASVMLIKEALKGLDNYKILFSAHGLPKKIIEQGDPYQWQIEKSVSNIVKSLDIIDLDYKISYQSRVGPVKWLTPNTEDEVILAAQEGKNIVVVPIAFVSEHSETLVELDIEYKDLVKDYPVKYVRVKTLSNNESFIKSLGEMVKTILSSEKTIAPSSSVRCCPTNFSKCPCKL